VISQPFEWSRAPDIVSDPNHPANTWAYYGRNLEGTRYAPFDQINRENVNELEPAWIFRTGEEAVDGSEDQNTPIQIGDTLYLCTPRNKVFALNAETGEPRWSFDPEVPSNDMWNRCRGVAYYEPGESAVAEPAATDPLSSTPSAGKQSTGTVASTAGPACTRRIITTTMTARLYSLDADTGDLCNDFGEAGSVDLSVGMGELRDWYYMPTSQPTVVNGLIIIGGWVWDGRETEEPSGVVRAFSADTGELVWAWDLANPQNTGLPPEGEHYTRGTPNFWSTAAVDTELG